MYLNYNIFTIFFITNLVSVFTVKYKFINNRLSWNQTSLYCRTRENGTLAKISDLNATNIQTDIWINQFKTLSDWIWSEGCYLKSFLTKDVKSYDLKSTVNIGACRYKCNTGYLGLRGTTCYCIKSLPRENTKSSVCDKPCTKDIVDYCGSNDGEKVSIYKIERNTFRIKYLPEEGATACAAYKIIGNSVLLEQIRCSNKMHVVCESYINGQMGLIKLNDVQNWTASLKTCKDFGLDLMDETPYEETRNHLNNGDLFWTGLFRRDITNMTSEIKDQSKSSDVCGYYNKTLGYVINLPWKDCMKKRLPSICIIDDGKMASPSSNIATDSSRPVVGIIIGVVVMVLAVIVIVVIIVAVYCKKFRQSTSSDLIPVEQETPKNPKPINLHPNYSIVILNSERLDEDGDTYADLYKGEYDVLHRKRKRNEDNHNDNIYNHTTNSGQEEDTYDHTQHVDRDTIDDETYNHTPRNYTNKGFNFEDDYHRIIKV